MMGNALHVHVHARIFISKGATGKCMIGAECLENRSALLSVDSATLPPSGTETQCRQAVFHYHHLQAVDFLPQRSGGGGGGIQIGSTYAHRVQISTGISMAS